MYGTFHIITEKAVTAGALREALAKYPTELPIEILTGVLPDGTGVTIPLVMMGNSAECDESQALAEDEREIGLLVMVGSGLIRPTSIIEPAGLTDQEAD